MTSLPSSSVRVKTECPDEAEIQELAAKMVEANKLKAQGAQTATQPRPALASMTAGPAGQLGMMNFLTRKSGAPASDKKPGEKTESDTKASDESSLRGQFGWTEIGGVIIPYILRLNEKYCAVHMVETKILNKYLNYLHQDIYSCTCIRSYYITEVESRLLNEINFKHSDGQFGKDYYTVRDLVVRLSDANEFYQFLDVCYKKLLDNSNNPKDKCGFIRINGESVVPYTVRGGQKFVPLFYFEGETDNLKLKADSLEGWDLSYLKFCCKVQGIRNELFASETCAVISLSDIKSYFPPGTNFEDYWPSKVMDSQLLVASKGSNPQNVGHWTRQPVGPPPRGSATQIPQQKTVARRPPAPNQVNAQRMTHPLQNTGMTSAAAAVQALSNGWAAAGLVGGQQAGFPALSHHQTQHVLRMAAQQQAHVQQVQAQAQAQAQHQQQVHQQAQAGRAAYQKAAANQVQAASRQYQQYNTNHAASMTMLSSQQPPPLVRTTQQSNIGSGAFQQSYLLGIPGQSYITPSIANLPTPPPTSTPGYTTPPAAYHIPPSTHSNPYFNPNTTSAQKTSGSHATSHDTVIKNYPINSLSAKNPPPLIPVNSSVIQRQNSAFATSALEVIDLSSPPRSPSVQRTSVGNGRTSIATGDNTHRLTSIPDTPTSGSHLPYKIQKALVEGEMVPSINMKPYVYTELLMTIVDLQKHFFPTVSTARCRQAVDALAIELYKGNRTQMKILQDNGKCSLNEVPPLLQVRDVMNYMPQLKYIIKASSSDSAPPSKRSRLS